jgi:hypothetical protein
MSHHVRLSFQPLISSQTTVFFSHSKSVNSTFSRLFLAKRKAATAFSREAKISCILE